MIDFPTIGLVLISSFISAINPCTIGILLLIISVVYGQGGSPSRLLRSGSIYLFALFSTYLLVGLGYSYVFSSLPETLRNYMGIVIGLGVVFAGLIQIKDFFWYGKGISLKVPDSFEPKLHNKSIKHKNILGLFAFGIFVALIELPCSGASYLAVVTILDMDPTLATAALVALYNLVFIIPLFLILVKVVRGTKTSSISRWKEKNKALMRLISGVLLVLLGWILLLTTNGTVSFG